MREKHASWQEILESIESPAKVDPSIRANLRSCRQCARLVEDARQMLRLFTDARLPEPPRALAEKTLAQLRTRLRGEALPAEWEQLKQELREALRRSAAKLTEIRATLVADSLRPSLAVRGPRQAGPRTLLFETDAFSVAVSLASGERGKEYEVMGQVAPKRGASLPPGGWVVVESGQATHECPITDLGQFTLQGVQPDIEEMTVVLGDSRIRLRIPPRAAS
jgi:hypothetical protein